MICYRTVFLLALLVLSAVAFAPPHQHRLTWCSSQPAASSSRLCAATAADVDYDTAIASAKQVLNKAATTKDEDPALVYEALVDLEKQMRVKCKAEGESAAQELLKQLDGNWRLVFTTGTAKTQEKMGKINYFPLKAVQSFDTETMAIENGIYVGDFPALKFQGEFDFDLRKRKLEFDFDKIQLFGIFTINLGKGDAAKFGASSGLGSESNVVNAKRDRQAFFNWISADETIATARGGGGGLALWKRVEKEKYSG